MKKRLPVQKTAGTFVLLLCRDAGQIFCLPALTALRRPWQRARRRRRSAGYAIRPTRAGPWGHPRGGRSYRFPAAFCSWHGTPAPRGRAARSSSMTAAFTPAPINTSGPSSSSRRRSSAASWEMALAAAPGTAARQHRVDAECRRSAVGGAQIAGNVDAAMQRDGRTAAGVQQHAHGGQIKRTLRRQCADDEAIRPGTAQRLDLAAEQLELVAGVQEIPRPRAHQAAHGQVQLGLDLPQQVGVGRQAAHGQCTAKIPAGPRPPALRRGRRRGCQRRLPTASCQVTSFCFFPIVT